MDGGLEQARPLRDVFASMSHGSADPATALAQAGHADLPGHLVTEAIISYADAAPVEVAEHLQPYVVANSAVPAADGHPYPVTDLPDAFALLSSAPDPVDVDPYDVHPADRHSVLDDGLHDPMHDPMHDGLHDAVHDPLHDGLHGDAQPDLWFGHGQAAAIDPDPLGDPLAAADDAGQRFADPGHPDPWLAGSGNLPPEHADALSLWDPQAETGHDLVDHPGDHQPVPVEDPGPDDLPDPGQA